MGFLSGASGAIEALMREGPDAQHIDRGIDGSFEECRSCRYLMMDGTCFFGTCPYDVSKGNVMTFSGLQPGRR